MNLTGFQFYYNSKSKNLAVVLPGISGGIGLPFMQKVIAVLREKGNSVLAFDFLFFEKGEEKSSGLELTVEQQTLKDLLEFVGARKLEKIRLVGKSLGSIVASYFLKSLPEEEKKKYSIVVLGYPLGEGGPDLKTFPGKIAVIQGEKDKHGGINKVKEELKEAVSKEIDYFEIPGADHSFRDPETKEPIYQDQVIELLRSL